MGKNFWLQFALTEALDMLTAYGSIVDPEIQPEIQNAASAIKALIAKLTAVKPAKA